MKPLAVAACLAALIMNAPAFAADTETADGPLNLVPVPTKLECRPGSFARVVRLFDWSREFQVPVYPATSVNKLNFGVRENSE